MTEYLPANQPK